MSSTGTVSSVIAGSGATLFQEEARVQQNSMAAMPSEHEVIRYFMGEISEVHSERPVIKVLSSKGVAAGGGGWIPLAHSRDEIVARFGTIRKGMKVQVAYSGPDGADAIASIIGVEKEELSDDPMPTNEVQKGLYAIFTPGSGGQ